MRLLARPTRFLRVPVQAAKLSWTSESQVVTRGGIGGDRNGRRMWRQLYRKYRILQTISYAEALDLLEGNVLVPQCTMSTRRLRNLAIIPPVDHGKPTLVDTLRTNAGPIAPRP